MSPSAARARRAKPRTSRQHRGSGALVIAVFGMLVPGTAYLAAGRKRLGAVLTMLSILLYGAAAYVALVRRDDVIEWALDPDALLGLIGGAGHDRVVPGRCARDVVQDASAVAERRTRSAGRRAGDRAGS